jgi:hypothetical protein
MQNNSKQQRYVIRQTAFSFQFCPRRTTSCSPEGIGNSSKESASAPATCNQTSEPRVDEFIGVYSEHPKISKVIKIKKYAAEQFNMACTAKLDQYNHQPSLPQPHLHGKRMQKS